MLDEHTPLIQVKGVGEKTAGVFAKAGIRTCGDLLSYFPRDYDYFNALVKVEALKDGQIDAVSLVILGNGSTVHAGGMGITTFRAGDETGQVKLTYFNQPYLTKTIRAGMRLIFRGKVRYQKNGLINMEQPSSCKPSEYEAITNTFQPKYPLVRDMKNSQVIRLMHRVLNDFSFPEEEIPEADLEALGLMPSADAFRKIHFPETKEDLIGARNRMVFDEFFAFIFTIRKEKKAEAKKNARPLHDSDLPEKLMERLPYELTNSQKKAYDEIRRDLTGSKVMNRLLQGDVGSGKTILAFLSLLLVAANGRQGAMMAPTEVLARQHYENLKKLIADYDLPLRPVLLTGSVKGAQRRKCYQEIENGTANVILGTHALIQESVTYHDLSLVITDEQHRFGVRQREALSGKGEEVPILVMSATPIPRTLAIILYGDLDVSRLTELPKNRLRIRNLAAPQSERTKIYQLILSQIRKGHQAYVICPAIEKNDTPSFNPYTGAPDLTQLENVTDYTKKLKSLFPKEVRIGMLHGKMKPKEKDEIMESFGQGEIDVLVSTTVIEVGIDVPNATVMVIENAERFGLSQLHQLRGRVGRGKDQSYCVFLYSAGIAEKPKRLSIMENTNDGFEIAEEDLKLRGPGDMFGTRQSGEMGFHLANIYEDAGMMTKAASYVDEVLTKNPDFTPRTGRQVDFRTI